MVTVENNPELANMAGITYGCYYFASLRPCESIYVFINDWYQLTMMVCKRGSKLILRLAYLYNEPILTFLRIQLVRMTQ